MNLRLNFTIAVSKLAIKFCRLTKRGGTTLPGKIARKLYPDIMKVISQNFKIIMVTGTNGKTTTTKIIGQILKENNIGFITNKSGANLLGGVITTFIEAVDIYGKCPFSTALIEIDEAAFKIASDYIEPDYLVVTNFFRDQLDRFGELYTTLNGVREGINKSSKTKLILNADDSLCASLAKDTKNQVLYFGFSQEAYDGINESTNSDASFCIYCKTKYEYENHVFGHLGFFNCPGCGYKRPDAQVSCLRVEKLSIDHTDMVFSVENDGKYDEYHARINLPGLYNVYNALASIALGRLLKLPEENSIKALVNVESGFGRMESINAGGKNIRIILVKNPTGFNQVLSYLLTEENNMVCAFVINDNLADGTDISWLWDVDFERLADMEEKTDIMYTSGIRAEDMAVRLKYAGLDTEKIRVLKDYNSLIEQGLKMTNEGNSFYILPTYTAMLDIRKILEEKFNLKEFWK